MYCKKGVNSSMEKVVIIIAGVPASGKTTYGRKLASRFDLPFFSKDKMKEVIYDSLDTLKEDDYEQKRKIGGASYSILWAICEEMMKGKASFIIESNFTMLSASKLEELIDRYSYHSIVLKFDADFKILHKRFLEREQSGERHYGLIANHFFDDFETFCKMNKEAKEFHLRNADEMLVNTGDFSKVDFDKIISFVSTKLY